MALLVRQEMRNGDLIYWYECDKCVRLTERRSKNVRGYVYCPICQKEVNKERRRDATRKMRKQEAKRFARWLLDDKERADEVVEEYMRCEDEYK